MPKRGAEERGEAGNSPEAKRRSDYHGFRSLVLDELARDNPGTTYRWRVGEVRAFVCWSDHFFSFCTVVYRTIFSFCTVDEELPSACSTIAAVWLV